MILIGKIVGPHGIKGTLKVKPYTDFLERFAENKFIKIRLENSLFEFLIEESFLHKNFVCLKLKGLESIDEALKFKNGEIVINEDELKKLQKDEYYIHDLIGLKVVGDNDIEIGVITDVISLSSNDVYEIDVEKRIIIIKNYEGYFDTNDAI